MPYHNLDELEHCLLITENHMTHEDKLPDRIRTAIDNIKDTDTKITFPWILKILTRHKDEKPWDNAYEHWSEIKKIADVQRKLFKVNMQDKQDQKAPAENTGQIDNQESSTKIHHHILQASEALQKIKITPENINDALILTCLVKGISIRLKQLDQGKTTGIVNHWLGYFTTQLIISKTGKNRESNFAPILNSLEKLVNGAADLRRLIPETIIAKQKIAKKSERFEEKQNIYYSPEDEKFNLENAMYQVTQIEQDIKNAKDDFIDKLIHYEDANKNFAELKKIEDKIYDAIDAERVLPYDHRYAQLFPLRTSEKLAWETYATQQDYYYYYFLINFIKKLLGYYESPEIIMQPLLQFIQRQEAELHKEYAETHAANIKYQELKKIKLKLHSDVKTTKIGLQLQKNSTAQNDMQLPTLVDLSAEFTSTKPKKLSRIRRYIMPILKILAGTAIGCLMGFGVGFALSAAGALTGVGIASVLSIPFFILIGGVIGFCATLMYVHNDFSPPSSPSLTAECIDCPANPLSPQNIHKQLRIQPEVQPSPTIKARKEKNATVYTHFDHKHAIQNKPTFISSSLKP
jgi:hypothetical protein